MRSMILMVCSITVALVIAGTLAAQEDQIFLKTDAFEPRQRTGVQFSHVVHEAIDCMDCHHEYIVAPDGAKDNIWDMFASETKCSACHTVDGDENVLGLMQAFHESCVACHRETLGQGVDTGPIMCGECHVR